MARRIRAARAYSGLTQEQLGTALGFSEPKMNRLEHGNYKRPLGPAGEEGVTRSTAKATGLPHEFFSIDFSRLPEMYAAWRQVQADSSTPKDLARELERDEGENLPPDSNGSQTGEQEP